MKFYTLLNISRKIKSQPLKLIGIYLLNILGKRHLSIRIDPSFNCNLFCRMCYFSSPSYRNANKGLIPESEFKDIARILFPYAFQVYVGCGAEPTTHRGFIKLVELAQHYKVPNIGIVTNGQLLSHDQIEKLVISEVDEITISCHGVYKENYEYFMKNSSYQRFIDLLDKINTIKNQHQLSKPEIRINYTVNTKNLTELTDFFKVFKDYNISTLQIRPVLNIGGSYSEAITDHQISEYNNIIDQIKSECSIYGVRLLANRTDIKYEKKNTNKKVAEAAYCYIGPNTAKKLNLEWGNINFKDFTKKIQWRRKTLKLIFKDKETSINKAAGNYDVFE
ncbi:radical SAM protein [Plebeiibacterium sediminum]|uniref:Radical SAM protein n=1 Tax=Plebeiibacterium sediminum TaxID=2992112 RepID=A0AAE3M4K2_9BACT|nr:radical SAM protein [Plebeiobacterium sediminum]MCW3786774.1 radical SAM protein [Plebeiobacterium sediminum]